MSLSWVVHRRDSHYQYHPQQPAENLDDQQDEGHDLQPRGGPGRLGGDPEALAGLGGDVGRVAEALQHSADGGFGLGVQSGPGGGDVLGDLVQDLAPAVGGQPRSSASRSVR